MEEYKNGKIERVLGIYTKLLNGYIVNKAAEANEYGVNERSIQRDVDDIRNYLEYPVNIIPRYLIIFSRLLHCSQFNIHCFPARFPFESAF